MTYQDQMINAQIGFLKSSVKNLGMIDIGKQGKPIYLMTKEHAVKNTGLGEYTSPDHAKDFFKSIGGECDFYILIPREDKPSFHGFNEDEFDCFIGLYIEIGV